MREIIEYARARIAAAHPVLTAALSRLRAEEGALFATDGITLFAPETELRDMFLGDERAPGQLLMHVLAHCLLGHPWLNDAADSLCDLQAELLIAELAPECCPPRSDGLFESVREYCRGAETISELADRLRAMELSYEKRERLRELTHMDSHILWSQVRAYPGGDGGADWRRLGRALTRNGGRIGTQAGDVVRTVTLPAREKAPYRDILRRYAVRREFSREDPDTLSAAWYHYGVERLGLPLYEPAEEREETSLYDLVIAVDTSGSCIQTLTARFLALTRDLLEESGLMNGRFNLHILQCDTYIRRDDVITDREGFDRYISALTVVGGGGTDFRPVFRHTDALIASGAFRDLRGIVFFSDGRGIFPERAPSYGTTFVFLKNDYDDIEFPAWAEKVILDMR